MRRTAPTFVLLALLAGCTSHAPLSCASEIRNWPLRSDLLDGIDPISITIRITRENTIIFNGQRVGLPETARYLEAADQQDPPPSIILDPADASSCDRIGSVRKMMDGLAMCRSGYCAERQQWDSVYGPVVAPPG